MKKDLNKIYLNIITEKVHPEVNFGNKFIGFITKKMNWIKSYVDSIKSKTCSAFGLTLNELVKYISDEYRNKADLQMYIDENEDTTLYLTLIGYYDKSPTNLARLLSEIKKSDEDFEQDKLTCVNNAGFHYIDEMNNIRIIGFNFEKYDKTTIMHEFSHMMQDLFYSNKFDGVDFNSEDAKDLGLDEEVLQYVYDENEFYTIIFNDLYHGLQKIYWIEYKDKMSWDDFIDQKVAVLKKNHLNVDNEEIQEKWIEYVNNDKSSIEIDFIKALAALVALDKEDAFDDAIEKLKEN